jgi:hypothetical protein
MTTVRVLPLLLSAESEMPYAGVTAVLTVTAQIAVLLPSAVVTVIVALPADTAVTKPLDDTVATEVELLLHDTF